MTPHAANLWRDIPPLWTVLAVYFAFSVRKLDVKRASAFPKFSVENSSAVLATLLIFFPSSHFSFLAWRFTNSFAVQLAGFCLTIAGLAFAAWSRDVLGRSWSAQPLIQKEHQLVTAGPYAYLRHPLYTGLLAALTGTVLVSGEWGAVLGLMLAVCYLWSKARREESLLESEFGPRYSAYREQTGFILPRIAHL